MLPASRNILSVIGTVIYVLCLLAFFRAPLAGGDGTDVTKTTILTLTDDTLDESVLNGKPWLLALHSPRCGFA
jgi:hypothetical protein